MSNIEVNNIKIYNGDCNILMKEKIEENSIDVVMTSPPYNMTGRKGGTSDKGGYDVYRDWMTQTEYLDFTVNVFNNFDRVLKPNGTVLYNFSYSIENPSLPHRLVCYIEDNTDFILVDTIVWKKKSGIPFPANQRRLSRIYEYVFVFCRKNEIDTFTINRKVKSVSEKTGQKYYEVEYNYVEAKNNDEKCEYNNATYSSELCEKMLNIYALENATVLDPFMGTGTTAVACAKMGLSCIGCELSENQINWAKGRIEKVFEEGCQQCLI